MRRLTRLILAMSVSAVLLLPGVPAAAERKVDRLAGTVSNSQIKVSDRKINPLGTLRPSQPKRSTAIKTQADGNGRAKSQSTQQRSTSRPRTPSRSALPSLREQRAIRQAAIRVNERIDREVKACAESALATSCNQAGFAISIPQAAAPPTRPGQPARLAQPAAPPPPVRITGEEAAYTAFVKIKLTAPTPTIGPPPSINPWKMAAVGYPLWLWSSGATDPPLVTDTIAGLFVSLDPHVTKTVYRMGDGTTLTCRGTGTRWTTAVPAGQKSPTCGHTYEKPSLPRGDYTITATTHWAVDWNANGDTGTIPLTQTATTTLPVGEIQVLIR